MKEWNAKKNPFLGKALVISLVLKNYPVEWHFLSFSSTMCSMTAATERICGAPKLRTASAAAQGDKRLLPVHPRFRSHFSTLPSIIMRVTFPLLMLLVLCTVCLTWYNGKIIGPVSLARGQSWPLAGKCWSSLTIRTWGQLRVDRCIALGLLALLALV